MPADWHGEIIGSQAEIRQKISEVLPGVDWSDLKWGIFEGDGFSYEFNIGAEEPSQSFMVHVRGGGSAIEPLLGLAQARGWYLLDCSQSEWLHHCDNPEAGWLGFQNFRDRVAARVEESGQVKKKRRWWKFW
jgi:hypothetical protein